MLETEVLKLLEQYVYNTPPLLTGRGKWQAPDENRSFVPGDYLSPRVFTLSDNMPDREKKVQSLLDFVADINKAFPGQLAAYTTRKGQNPNETDFYLTLDGKYLDTLPDKASFLRSEGGKTNVLVAQTSLATQQQAAENQLHRAPKPTPQDPDTILKEVLRCHGYEKNGVTLSLYTPEALNYLLKEKEPRLVNTLPKDIQKYVNEKFQKDCDLYADYSARIAAHNSGNKAFRELSEAEYSHYDTLQYRITRELAAPTIQAVIVDSGLFTDADFAAGKVSVKGGQVKIHDASSITPEQMKAASQYVYARQPVRDDKTGEFVSAGSFRAAAIKAEGRSTGGR